jgi:integrase
MRFCTVLGTSPYEPISESQLCLMCWLWVHANSVRSIPSWLYGVEQFLRDNKLPKLERGEMLANQLQGMTSIYGPIGGVHRAPALEEATLLKIRSTLDLRLAAHAEFWCALLFGFQGLFRASEMVAGRMLHKDIRSTAYGLVITVPFSKANPSPVDVTLITRNDLLCPTAAYKRLSSFKGNAPNSPLFSFTYAAFNEAVSAVSAAAGGPGDATSHSLRRGGATALYNAGVPEELIRNHGRWSSAEWRKYIGFGPQQQQRPTSMLLLHRSGQRTQ